jgi:hypothetical protein
MVTLAVQAEVDLEHHPCHRELAELVHHHHRTSAQFHPPTAPTSLPPPCPPSSQAYQAKVRVHSLFPSPATMGITHRSTTVIVAGFTRAPFHLSLHLLVLLACVGSLYRASKSMSWPSFTRAPPCHGHRPLLSSPASLGLGVGPDFGTIRCSWSRWSRRCPGLRQKPHRR